MHAPINVFNDDYQTRLFDYAWEFLMRSRWEDPLTPESRAFLAQLRQQQQLQQDHVAIVEELILRGMERLKRIWHDHEQVQRGVWSIVKISLRQQGGAVQQSGVNSGAAAMPVSPSAQTVQQTAVSSPGTPEPQGRSPWLAGLVIGGTCMTAVLTILFAFSDLSQPDHQPEVDSPPAVSAVPSTPSPSPIPESSPSSPVEFAQPEKDPIWRDRVVQLAINGSFFEGLLRDRGALDDFAPVKTNTPEVLDQSAVYLLDRLQTLPVETRSKLGSYDRLDYDQWLATGVDQRRLDQLANQAFYQLFPEMKGKTTNPTTFGQIWFALAEDQLKNARIARSRNRFRANDRTDPRLPRRSGRQAPISGIRTI